MSSAVLPETIPHALFASSGDKWEKVSPPATIVCLDGGPAEYIMRERQPSNISRPLHSSPTTMQSFAVLSALFCVASAQLAAWPGSSFNPYYQSILGPARTPVNAMPVAGAGIPGAPSVIPAPPPVAPPVYQPYLAAPALPVAAPLPVPAPLPVAAPVPFAAPALPVAAPLPFAAPAPAPFFAPAPVPVPAPVFAAPAVPVLPRVVPAYAPFATSAMFIGSNKAKTA